MNIFNFIKFIIKNKNKNKNKNKINIGDYNINIITNLFHQLNKLIGNNYYL